MEILIAVNPTSSVRILDFPHKYFNVLNTDDDGPSGAAVTKIGTGFVESLARHDPFST